jgi:hypothetical protein
MLDITSTDTVPGAEEEKDQATPAPSLEQLEEIITRNLPSKAQFIQAGEALKAIRDGKLFRPKFKTWTEYVKERWGFSRQYADRLIKAADFASTVVDKPPTEREALKRRMEQRGKSIPPSFAAEVRKFTKFLLRWQKDFEPKHFRSLLKEMEEIINGLLQTKVAEVEEATR